MISSFMTMHGDFPARRLRRLRSSKTLRDAVADVRLAAEDFIYPVFVGDFDTARPVESMPNINQLPVAEAVSTIIALSKRGLRQFILFGVTPDSKKNLTGSYALDPHAPVNRTLRDIRSAGSMPSCTPIYACVNTPITAIAEN